MNESTSGFIFFSFGSMVKIESFPDRYLKIFYNSLEKIAPIRVLVKIATPTDLPPGLPKNIRVLPWIPQVKVLSELISSSIRNYCRTGWNNHRTNLLEEKSYISPTLGNYLDSEV